METPLEGHCATLELAGLTDCLRIALASERAARQAQRWETGKERGQMNAALKGEMARAEKAEQEAKRLRIFAEGVAETLARARAGWDAALHGMIEAEEESKRLAIRAEKAEKEAKTWKDWSLTICEAAEAYRHYAAHPAGTESVVAQLRILRRAIRDAALEKKP